MGAEREKGWPCWDDSNAFILHATADKARSLPDRDHKSWAGDAVPTAYTIPDDKHTIIHPAQHFLSRLLPPPGSCPLPPHPLPSQLPPDFSLDFSLSSSFSHLPNPCSPFFSLCSFSTPGCMPTFSLQISPLFLFSGPSSSLSLSLCPLLISLVFSLFITSYLFSSFFLLPPPCPSLPSLHCQHSGSLTMLRKISSLPCRSLEHENKDRRQRARTLRMGTSALGPHLPL